MSAARRQEGPGGGGRGGGDPRGGGVPPQASGAEEAARDRGRPLPYRVARWGKFWSLEPLFADLRSYLVAKGGPRPKLDDLVLALFERETLNKKELEQVFAPVVKRSERPVWLSSARRVVSDVPPVLTPTERSADNGHATAPRGLVPPPPVAPPVADEH